MYDPWNHGDDPTAAELAVLRSRMADERAAAERMADPDDGTADELALYAAEIEAYLDSLPTREEVEAACRSAGRADPFN